MASLISSRYSLLPLNSGCCVSILRHIVVVSLISLPDLEGTVKRESAATMHLPYSHSIVPGGFEVMFRLRRINSHDAGLTPTQSSPVAST